jgi:hypothetical protein
MTGAVGNQPAVVRLLLDGGDSNTDLVHFPTQCFVFLVDTFPPYCFIVIHSEQVDNQGRGCVDWAMIARADGLAGLLLSWGGELLLQVKLFFTNCTLASRSGVLGTSHTTVWASLCLIQSSRTIERLLLPAFTSPLASLVAQCWKLLQRTTCLFCSAGLRLVLI